MRRRDLLKAAGAGLAAIAAPRIGWSERTNKLVFVPTEDLGALDPVVAPFARRAITPISCSIRFTASILTGWRSLRWSKGIRSKKMD